MRKPEPRTGLLAWMAAGVLLVALGVGWYLLPVSDWLGAVRGWIGIIPGTVKDLTLMQNRRDHFQAGSSDRTLNFVFKDTSWIPLVNWEAGDPLLVRAAVNKQIQVIVALVDPLPGGPGSRAAFSNLRLWSVSLGRPIIFASAKNFAAIVSRSGKLVADARLTPGNPKC